MTTYLSGAIRREMLHQTSSNDRVFDSHIDIIGEGRRESTSYTVQQEKKVTTSGSDSSRGRYHNKKKGARAAIPGLRWYRECKATYRNIYTSMATMELLIVASLVPLEAAV